MKKYFFLFFVPFLLLILAACQETEENNFKEIPVIYENLAIEDLKEQSALPLKLPTLLPFEPKETFAELSDYKDLYANGETIEEVYIHYIKTHNEGRYLDVLVTNLEEQKVEGDPVTLSNGSEAVFSEDEIGQLLYWEEDGLHYRLVFYTSDKVNEGQEPLKVEELIEIADSFK